MSTSSVQHRGKDQTAGHPKACTSLLAGPVPADVRSIITGVALTHPLRVRANFDSCYRQPDDVINLPVLQAADIIVTATAVLIFDHLSGYIAVRQDSQCIGGGIHISGRIEGLCQAMGVSGSCGCQVNGRSPRRCGQLDRRVVDFDYIIIVAVFQAADFRI